MRCRYSRPGFSTEMVCVVCWMGKRIKVFICDIHSFGLLWTRIFDTKTKTIGDAAKVSSLHSKMVIATNGRY